jgi:DNA-binding MarR family transcriptional regulator
MRFKEKSVTEQVVSLQQVWKRLKVSEWQIINEIADATGATFEQVEQLLYQHPTLPDFIETMQEEGFLNAGAINYSQADLSSNLLLLTKSGFAWGEVEDGPLNSAIEAL